MEPDPDPAIAIDSPVAPDPNIDPDDTDEGYSSPAHTSYATSLASSIRNGTIEYGRQFATYGKHSYALPIDEDEQRRHDLQHAKFTLMYNGRLHMCPLPEDKDAALKILDLGTGTGEWAIEMADAYGSSHVLGIDIAPTMSTWVPPNCEFEIMDMEDEWALRSDYDFIHCREALMAVRDFPALIARAYAHLKPGGYCEFACTLPVVDADDGTMPEDCGYKAMSEIYFQIAEAIGIDGYAPKKYAQWLKEAGFVDVTETPLKMPVNRWPKEKRLKDIGTLEMENFLQYTTAGFEKGYVGVMGGDKVQLEVMLAKARKDITDRKIHGYGLL
jgi:SAM-dependent methyltransferase